MTVKNYPFIPSPNFNDRQNDWNISILVLHYTVTDFETTKKTFLDPTTQESAHYVVDVDGSIYQFVEEEKRAWHAGVSYFNGITDVNSHSIGIEIINAGYDINNVAEYPAYPYTEAQMNAVIDLSKDIVNRYSIPPFCVVGHSDVAPSRKIDPGPHFPWEAIHKQGLGLLPNYDLFTNQDILNTVPSNLDDQEISKLLSRYGYEVTNLTHTKRAFQMHFNQEAYLRKQAFGTYDLSMLKELLRQKADHPVQFKTGLDSLMAITHSGNGNNLELWLNHKTPQQFFILRYDKEKDAYQIWDLDENYILAWNVPSINGRHVFMHPNENRDEHYWILELQANQSYVIASYKNKDMVLEVTDSNTTNGTPIQVHLRNGNRAQEFHMTLSNTNDNQQYETIIHDSFSSWDTSIFQTGGLGNPTMSNGFLSLPYLSRVSSRLINLEKNATYRITIKNLSGEVGIGMYRYGENYMAYKSTGSNVSFLHTHDDDHPAQISLRGLANSTSKLSSFKIERQF